MASGSRSSFGQSTRSSSELISALLHCSGVLCGGASGVRKAHPRVRAPGRFRQRAVAPAIARIAERRPDLVAV
eukprot:scaffold72935_cov63-Phaeocystis_antarctica.AAC.3